jgi:acyl-CoA synthetase (AMP-forming)/AMP-acid ligase II
MHDTLDRPQINISDVIARHGRHKARKPAVICGAAMRDWGDFDANVSRIAHALQDRGFGRGDRVAVVMENSVEMLEAVFGIIRAGCCAAPLSGMLTPEQMARLVADSRARALFASAAHAQGLDAQRAAMPGVAEGARIAHGFDAPGWTPFAAFMAGKPATRPQTEITPEDEFNIIYSSGTTGTPKGIVQTHAARGHFAWSNAVEMAINASARSLTTTPLYSNGTWLMMLPTIFAGGTLHVMPAFDVGAFLETVEREGITHTFMVPAQFIMILSDPRLAGANLSSLRGVLSAGSPLRGEVKRDVMARISPQLYELYGFSEGFASMLKPDEHARKFTTVGTPVLGFEVRVIDDEGRECAPGEPGEIVAYGAGMLRDYNDAPEQTAALIWRDERGRTFIRSGDVGKLDADGFLSIVDRKKDMIVSGGFNVFPTDIEAVVAGHPDVWDAAVIGIPHDKWGETCLALVIARPGVTLDREAVKLWANDRLAKHQRLAAVEPRADFPRNALGKVIKRELRDPYWTDGAKI